MLAGERSAGFDTGYPGEAAVTGRDGQEQLPRAVLAGVPFHAAGAPPTITIRPATVQDAVALAANLRPEVRAEAEGVYDDLVGGFAWGIMESAEAWVAVESGEISPDVNERPTCEFSQARILAAWGIVDEGSLLVPVGRVWCMTTPLVEQHRRHFARESRRIVSHWRRRYWRLHNEVDARNAASVRWLEWLGFRVGKPWQDDERGLMWRSFEWQADG
jgi:hypothetical protein